jgi:hypothetical protein
MTLQNLRYLLVTWMGRTDPDFVNNTDHLIRLGHRYVERQWQGREQQFTVWVQQVPMAAGTWWVPLPAEYRASAALNVDMYPPNNVWVPAKQLVRVPVDAFAVDAPWRLPDGTTINAYDRWTPGEPRVYCVMGRQLQVRPVAAAAQTIAITGTGWTVPLWYDTDETIVTQAAGEAVLYAALREAWGFLGDPVQKATWEAEANRAIETWVRDGTQGELAARLPLVMETPG